MITFISVHFKDDTLINVAPAAYARDGFVLGFGDLRETSIFLTPLSARRLVERLQEALDNSSRAAETEHATV